MLQGVLAIADPIKPTSAQAVRKLNELGIHTVMLTGDHTSVANAIAKELGISQVIAQVLPDQKAQHIQALQQQGRKVAMIGDGINDAPALALADIGIAMGSGSDVAIESAQMTLLNSSPTSVVSAIELSKATLRNMRQNLFGAFIYNTLAFLSQRVCFTQRLDFYSAQLSPVRRWRSPRSPWSVMPIACAGAKFLSINILNEVHHETHNADTRPIGHIFRTSACYSGSESQISLLWLLHRMDQTHGREWFYGKRSAA